MYISEYFVSIHMPCMFIGVCSCEAHTTQHVHNSNVSVPSKALLYRTSTLCGVDAHVCYALSMDQ